MNTYISLQYKCTPCIKSLSQVCFPSIKRYFLSIHYRFISLLSNNSRPVNFWTVALKIFKWFFFLFYFYFGRSMHFMAAGGIAKAGNLKFCGLSFHLQFTTRQKKESVLIIWILRRPSFFGWRGKINFKGVRNCPSFLMEISFMILFSSKTVCSPKGFPNTHFS